MMVMLRDRKGFEKLIDVSEFRPVIYYTVPEKIAPAWNIEKMPVKNTTTKQLRFYFKEKLSNTIFLYEEED